MGTDGIDGESDAAGAISDSNSLGKSLDMGMKPEYFLRKNDSYHYFKSLDDLIMTGSTGTNAADVEILIVI